MAPGGHSDRRMGGFACHLKGPEVVRRVVHHQVLVDNPVWGTADPIDCCSPGTAAGALVVAAVDPNDSHPDMAVVTGIAPVADTDRSRCSVMGSPCRSCSS